MFKLLASGVVATLFSLFTMVPAFAADNGIAYAIHTIRAETGKACMVGHFHHGKSPAYVNKTKALRAAKRHYSSFTALEYGTDWGHFELSANRSVNCEKVSSSQWMCKVKGRPCRKGRRVASR